MTFKDSLVSNLKCSMKIKYILTRSALAIGLAVIILTLACKQEKKEPIKDGQFDQDKQLHTISLERAHQMYQAYQERYNALTEFRKGNEDARYGWHSIGFYKNYIAFLEKESKRVNIPISGIRLYYVAYPEDESSHQYKGYQTYIYVPTYYNEKTKQHIAFDLFHLDAQGQPIPIHNIITKGEGISNNLSSSFFYSVSNETASSVANMGEMCKPNCSE